MARRALGAALGTAIALAAQPAFAQSPRGWADSYAGFNIGYGHASSTFDYSGTTGVLPLALQVGQYPRQISTNPDGVIGGVQLGYNFQSGAVVWGIEADTEVANLKSSQTYRYTGPFAAVDTTATASLDWLSTVRGRLGFTPQRNWLVFGTAGLAIANTSTKTSARDVNGGGYNGSSSDTRLGWVAGLGSEVFVTRFVSARVEYLHFDVGGKSFGSVGIQSGAILNADTTFTGDVVRGALNFHFN